MNTAIGRMGILYGKLGLSTPEATIAARGRGVELAAEAFDVEFLPDILACAFQFGTNDELLPLSEKFSQEDSTFDVRKNDKEGALLAATILSYEMQSGTEFGTEAAFVLVTACFGGIRKLTSDPEVIEIAEKHLANTQSLAAGAPGVFTAAKSPKALAEAIARIPESGGVDGSVMRPVLLELQKLVEGRAQASATADNALLSYISRLEEELRTYWWVVSGWSASNRKPFRDIDLISASLLAGSELAAKTTLPLGLFAAPALCDMVLRVGRESIDAQVTLASAATALDRETRRSEFGEIAESEWAPWLPLSTAMGLAALSDDERDWEPRFRRTTGLNPKAKLRPLEFAVQMYRERLVARQHI
ncbi:GTPase-associated system all-helical protein GASH [Sphingosinicella sp.]|uniref:GTPase-associated system all-helical protein GASH n=1 Tax=Sphingosinicella sp. TaxID=1917971 RepID=UPI00180A94F7|nr:GTPase-associated system all-helical protein GASH [Sphingosinicella sp.]MBA4760008.1 hypothetical protein [Sphingosinicella sp.]